MKRIIAVINLFLLIFTLSSCKNVFSKVDPIEDFEYELENGEVIITGYKGEKREIYIPSQVQKRPVTVIGVRAFEGYDLTRITLPDSVKEIQKEAFLDCECLENIKFSESLETIGTSAFNGCGLLKEINLPKGLKEIDSYAFNRCTALKNVELPKNIEYIASYAFSECDNLKKLEIPYNAKIDVGHTVQSIGNGLGSMETFYSPVGGSFKSYIINKYTNEPIDSSFDELPTTLVVWDGSYAHQEVQKNEGYGLNYEVK